MAPEANVLDFEIKTSIANPEFFAALMSQSKRRSDPRDLQQVLLFVAELDRITRAL